ncbi:phosphopantetheine-binding protein [Stenotrophomonas maltophilia]|jgi:aryl carrier-like protein|uniref:Phosphopantetheine-binding protein n=1 Tax=Stenotrophomonas maltophilia TaxID=40324 RepID=A0AAP7KZ99_STEMA|nr:MULTISPECIES: phosphopantetheine-binding protein [Stenotrophomonas]KOQ69655.1 phosphopantetheine-binding protein [Stenotrophomonas maltophilia]MBA0220263.1 phosphopantetheine-binding protein [Stenotrophomonas maltophilia]MBH1663911.1 phosphopantetheine-binding protein [Stenotrophomonas maltophilia]MBH1834515.1 phosphopantetheine-binding protein [Stenotrophomonas maltophilia]MCO7397891.1 phosphopantetheine-binding protein [Stenotrophomonas maltophilia]
MDRTGDVLDLERMRADVARVLECEPADIGDDDNLIDLDLDSMRMLGLVLAWSNTGLPLEFSQLAEHTTLRQWWQVVQRLQAAQGA